MNLLYLLKKKNTKNKDNIDFEEFSFTSDYIIEFDKKNKIKIRKRENVLDFFYGENISSVKVIAGSNGAGKSRMLKSIIEAISIDDRETVLIFEDNFNFLYFSNFQEIVEIIDTKNEIITKTISKEELFSEFQVMFVSNAIELTSTVSDSSYSLKNLSTTKYLSEMSLNRMILEDTHRQIKLLSSSELQEILLKSEINLNNLVKINLLINNEYENVLLKNNFFSEIRQKSVENVFTHNKEALDLYFLTSIYEIFEDKEKIIFSPVLIESFSTQKILNVNETIDKLLQFIKNLDKLLISYEEIETRNNFKIEGSKKSFSEFYSNEKEYIIKNFSDFKLHTFTRKDIEILYSHFKKITRKRLFEIDNKIRDLKKISEYDINLKETINSKWDFSTNQLTIPYKNNEIQYFLNLKSNFVTSQKLLLEWKSISSGEYNFLNVICRVITEIKVNNKIKTFFMIFDESDLGFHPMWQKKWFKLVVDILTKMFPDKNFQLIISTHSPFLLSDMLEEDVFLLKKGEWLFSNKTFGANIHNLYQDNFFISGSKMGDFSKIKIDTMIKELTSENDIDKNKLSEFKYIINQIGEPILRRELERILQLKDKDTAIDYYKEKIRELGGDIIV